MASGAGTLAPTEIGIPGLFFTGRLELAGGKSVRDGGSDGFLGLFPPVAQGVMADSGLGGDLLQRDAFEPVPADVVAYLPPAPEGYVFGFVDGYCVVYDPNTFLVIDVIDLF